MDCPPFSSQSLIYPLSLCLSVCVSPPLVLSLSFCFVLFLFHLFIFSIVIQYFTYVHMPYIHLFTHYSLSLSSVNVLFFIRLFALVCLCFISVTHLDCIYFLMLFNTLLVHICHTFIYSLHYSLSLTLSLSLSLSLSLCLVSQCPIVSVTNLLCTYC